MFQTLFGILHHYDDYKNWTHLILLSSLNYVSTFHPTIHLPQAYPLQGHGGQKPVTASRDTCGGHPEQTASPSRVSHTTQLRAIFTVSYSHDAFSGALGGNSRRHTENMQTPRSTIAITNYPLTCQLETNLAFVAILRKLCVDIKRKCTLEWKRSR